MDSELNHSIENIYFHAGQFDHRYVVFNFHYNSPAYRLYGPTVHGILKYAPSERAKLEEAMQAGNNSNSDGTVRLDSNLQDKNLYDRLLKEGFSAQDVASLQTVDSKPPTKFYGKKDVRPIPNTITVSYRALPSDLLGLTIINFEHRIKDGLRLLPNEERQYILYKYLSHPSIELWDAVKVDLINPETGAIHDDAGIAMGTYLFNNDSTNKELNRALNWLLEKRRKERIGYVLNHLGIAQKHLDKLKAANDTAWKELMKAVYQFEPEMIVIWGWKYPVWWDFERFIHIFLRHYESFYIEESTRGQGTPFPYKFKDIRRLIGIILKHHKDEIEERLSNGLPYNRYDEHGYYYNGNFYTFRIDKEGKLMQFHPQETPVQD